MKSRDPLKVPMRNRELAIATTDMLERVTGDRCAVNWDDINKFTIVRQPPEGKIVNG